MKKEAETGLQIHPSVEEVLLAVFMGAQAAGMYINVAIIKMLCHQRKVCPLCGTPDSVGPRSNPVLIMLLEYSLQCSVMSVH